MAQKHVHEACHSLYGIAVLDSDSPALTVKYGCAREVPCVK